MRRTFVLISMALAAGAALGVEQRLVLDPARTEVSFDLEATGHDVHGLLAMQAGEIVFDAEQGTARGGIVLDAVGAGTGNSSRDRTMRRDVLEVERFPVIEFAPERVTGTLAAEGSSQLTLHGVLTLHGEPHAVALPAIVDVQGRHVTADATFKVPYQEWGLRDPSVLFLKVARVVAVKVHADGDLEAALESAAGSSR